MHSVTTNVWLACLLMVTPISIPYGEWLKFVIALIMVLLCAFGVAG